MIKHCTFIVALFTSISYGMDKKNMYQEEDYDRPYEHLHGDVLNHVIDLVQKDLQKKFTEKQLDSTQARLIVFKNIEPLFTELALKSCESLTRQKSPASTEEPSLPVVEKKQTKNNSVVHQKKNRRK